MYSRKWVAGMKIKVIERKKSLQLNGHAHNRKSWDEVISDRKEESTNNY